MLSILARRIGGGGACNTVLSLRLLFRISRDKMSDSSLFDNSLSTDSGGLEFSCQRCQLNEPEADNSGLTRNGSNIFRLL